MRSMPMPHAKPVNCLRVVSDGLEDRRVHHAAAAQLDPAGLLAHRTAGAVALPAAEIDFRARLRIREEARTETHAHVRREHLARERQQRAFQIGQRQAFADGQPLDLSEGRRVRQVQVVASIDAAGHDDANRRLMRLHVANLHRRGMRAQQRARRALRRVPAAATPRYSVSCMSRAGCSAGMFSASKQCHSSSTSGPSTTANPMRVKISSRRSRTVVSGWRWPSRRRAARQRDVDGAGRHPIARGFLVLRPARFDRLLQLVGPASDLLLLVGRRRPDHLHPRRDDAVLAAEEAIAHGLCVAGRRRRARGRSRTPRSGAGRILGWAGCRS